MKITKFAFAAAFALSALSAPLALAAGDHDHDHGKKEEKSKSKSSEICVVSGDKLGEMGKPYVFKHEGREIKLCCKDCKKDFDKDPAKYLKKLDEKNDK